jgi:peptidyl-prolyl cis-trans isomerase C
VRLTSLLLIAVSLAACSKQDEPASPVVTTIAGQAIHQDFLDYYISKQTGADISTVSPEMRAKLLEDLKRLVASAAKGAASGDPTLRHAVELAKLDLQARAAAEAAGVTATPSDADLQQAYQAFVTSMPSSEYHVAHILVPTENLAAGVIVQLQGGQDFAQLAADKSVDDSKSRGGDLGWIAPGKLPAEFTDAVAALEPGEFTQQPIHTSYGWHVIQLLETRPFTAPPFEQVRAQLASSLQQDRYKQFLDDNFKATNTTR